ncbi:MAG: DUF4012 domain-containing protein [Acidimicrobiales bacterium]
MSSGAWGTGVELRGGRRGSSRASRSWHGGPGRWKKHVVQPSHAQVSDLLVLALALATAAGGALAGCHPTATPVVDPLYSAALAAIVTFAASRADRETWLVVSAGGVLMSRGWLVLPALCALGLAVTSVAARRSRRRTGGLVGALLSQVLLRWPPFLFHGFTALVAAIVVALLVVSAYRRARTKTRRRILVGIGGVVGVFVLLSLPSVVGALLVRGDLTNGEQQAERAFDSVSGGTAQAATAQLRSAASDFGSASSQLGGWWTAISRVVPVVSQQRQLLAQLTEAAQGVSRVAEGEASKVDYQRLDYHDGQIDLRRLEAMGPPMGVLSSQVDSAVESLRTVRSQWVLSPIESRFERLDTDLSRARSSTSLAVKAIRVLPGLLGADGTRHYFIAFMTPSESRGLDGIVGSYGELTADQGRVSLATSGPIVNLYDEGIPTAKRTLTGPADFLARYGAFDPARYPEDSTYSPDLPTVSQVISQLYPQEGGNHIDGVLGIDPYGLASLLKFTGPITVPGLPVPLDSANAARVLLTDQYTIYDNGQPNDLARHDFLQDALHLAFHDLVNGSLPGPRTLSQELEPAVRQGRIEFWSTRPGEQGVIDDLGLSGAFPSSAGGDLLAVTTQNAGNNKIDAFLHESLHDSVRYDPGSGDVSSQVTISLENDAPASGLPPIVLESPKLPSLAPGTNATWLSVYSPLQLAGATIGGKTVTLASGHELGVNVFSQYLYIPPESTLTVRLSLAGRLADRDRYSTTLRLQPMANPLSASVTVHPVSGWVGPDGRAVESWTAGPDEVQQHRFSFSKQ